VPSMAEQLHQENPLQVYERLRFQEPIDTTGGRRKTYAFLLEDMSRIDLQVEESTVAFLPLVRTTVIQPWPYNGYKYETFAEKNARLKLEMEQILKKENTTLKQLSELTGLSKSTVLTWLRENKNRVEPVAVQAEGFGHGAITYRWRNEIS
jgi:lambda repressor-like predicted transcriptional regulator